MKPINLYDIYRNVKQRTRSIKSIETQRKTEEMIAAAERIVTERPTLKLVAGFRKAENEWRLCYDVSTGAKSMADQFEAAIKSNNFEVKRWLGNRKGTISEYIDSGLIYCASDATKPGQLKIGVTSKMTLKNRLQKMQAKYGYANIHPLFSIKVSMPYEIEDGVQKKLRDLLVSGCTKGDSVEWYYASAIEFARAVVDTVEEHGNSVDAVTLFADCPNAGKVKVALKRLANVNTAAWG